VRRENLHKNLHRQCDKHIVDKPPITPINCFNNKFSLPCLISSCSTTTCTHHPNPPHLNFTNLPLRHPRKTPTLACNTKNAAPNDSKSVPIYQNSSEKRSLAKLSFSYTAILHAPMFSNLCEWASKRMLYVLYRTTNNVHERRARNRS
jgi:hypothetical protein